MVMIGDVLWPVFVMETYPRDMKSVTLTVASTILQSCVKRYSILNNRYRTEEIRGHWRTF